MICQALRISIFNSFHSVTRITYNVHKILQGVPKKWARSDPKWPRPSERTWMAQSGPKWPKIPASHHSPQNFKSTFFLGHPVGSTRRGFGEGSSRKIRSLVWFCFALGRVYLFRWGMFSSFRCAHMSIWENKIWITSGLANST